MKTDGRTDRRIDMTRLIVAFRNFANAPKKSVKHWWNNTEKEKPKYWRKNNDGVFFPVLTNIRKSFALFGGSWASTTCSVVQSNMN